MPQQFKVGDFARNIESGWVGKIVEIGEPEKVMIDDTNFFMQTMAKMVGVDIMGTHIAGLPKEESLSEDDVQYHSLADLKLVK